MGNRFHITSDPRESRYAVIDVAHGAHYGLVFNNEAMAKTVCEVLNAIDFWHVQDKLLLSKEIEDLKKDLREEKHEEC